MQLTKSESGVIYDDRFNTQNPEWGLLNAGSVSFADNKMTLNHSEQDTYAAMTIPADAYAFEAFVNYTPVTEGDEGGLVLYNTSTQNYKLLEVADAETSDLTNFKVIRTSENNYDLFILRNGAYMYVDSVAKDIEKIGFVLKGGMGADFVPLEVNRFVITKDDVVRVDKVIPGYTVTLTSSSQSLSAVSDDYGVVLLKLPHLAANYEVTVKNTDDVLVSTQTLEICGGDIFYMASLLEIRESGAELSTTTPNHMGAQASGALVKQYEIYNPTSSLITGINLKVIQYLNEFGYELVDIAPDVSSAPGTYTDVLNIAQINGNETIPFWIKLDNTTAEVSIAKFAIELNHD